MSILTPPGRGAVGVVAAVGPAAERTVAEHFQAASGSPLEHLPKDRVAFGHWTAGDHREEVVLVRTGADAFEIHCHGGIAAPQRIVAALAARGCRLQPWQQWIGRRGDEEIAAEAEIALAHATTRRTATILLDQRHGALQRALAMIERAIAAGDNFAAKRQVFELLARAPLGLHLAQPWRIAIAGRPNVGKSSLINALVGYERAIVFDKPGTTRDLLAADTAVDGWLVRLIDAAGIRPTCDPLEAEGVARARQLVATADLVLWVLDATAVDDPEETAIAAELAALPPARVLRVLNKTDLMPPNEPRSDGVPVSALTGQGLDCLLAAIAQRLVPHPPPPAAAVPFTLRHRDVLQQLAQRLATP